MLSYPNIKNKKMRTIDNINMITLGRVEILVKSTPKIDEYFEKIENIFVDVDIPISLVFNKGK
jgi:hypothetical protein